MALVVNTIGTGRDFATIALWKASLPANIVNSGNIYQASFYNDFEFTGANPVLDLSSFVTDSTHYIILTTAAGQSFRDQVNLRSNALKYDITNGVGIRGTSGTAATILACQFLVVSNLQIQNVGSSGYPAFKAEQGDATVSDCIICANGESFERANVPAIANTVTVNRCVIYSTAASGSSRLVICTVAGTTNFNGCTIGSVSDASPQTKAFDIQNSVAAATSVVLENCAVYGITSLATLQANCTISYTNCMTDTTGTTGIIGGTTFANQFVGISNATLDWREKAGADLQHAGVLDLANDATDISGTTRANPPDIGAWELSGSTAVLANSYVSAESNSTDITGVGSRTIWWRTN